MVKVSLYAGIVLWSPVILVVLISVVLVRVGGMVEAPSWRRKVAGLTRVASGMILQSEV